MPPKKPPNAGNSKAGNSAAHQAEARLAQDPVEEVMQDAPVPPAQDVDDMPRGEDTASPDHEAEANQEQGMHTAVEGEGKLRCYFTNRRHLLSVSCCYQYLVFRKREACLPHRCCAVLG